MKKKTKENLSLISFYQTYFGIRMWSFSFSIRIDDKTMEVLNFLSSISYDKVKMKMTAGSHFSRKDVLATKERDIEMLMTAEEGGVIGGMTYRLDPDLKEYNERKKQS